MVDQILSVSFQIISLLYIFITMIVYNKKEKIMIIENVIYKQLLLFIPGIIILDIISIIGPLYIQSFLLFKIIRKIFYILLIIWLSIIASYLNIHAIQKERDIVPYKNNINKKLYDKVQRKYFIAVIIFSIVTFILETTIKTGEYYTYYSGMSAYVSIGYGTFLLLACISFLIIDIKRHPKKEYFPYFLLIFLIICSFLLEIFFNDINTFSSMATFITIFMYFTLENPDISLINQLALSKKISERASQDKTNLLLEISKDVKTPLNAISGFATILKEEVNNKKTAKEVELIYSQSIHLLSIINELIDIANIETKSLSINNNEYDVRKVFNDVANLGRVRLSSKRINFNYQISSNIPEVLFGDSKRIKQILLNIITNATKYTSEGYISFIVNSSNYADNCRLQIIVDDSGIGMSEEKIASILNSTSYVKITNNLNGLGTGYGLSITKKLIEMMGGTIKVVSSVGRGTKVTVEIDQKISSKRASQLIIPEVIYNKPFDASSYKVLVVDDNMLNLRVARRFLKRYNIDADIVQSGNECLDILKKKKYDLIFLDDQMPVLNGRDTLKKISSIPDINAKVIALTANDGNNVREEYKQMGFDDYLKKPIDTDDLHTILKKYIKH